MIWDDLRVDVNAAERFPGYRFSAVIIGEVVWLRYRFNLSLRDIPALVARSGIVLSHETVRQWCDTFGPDYAKQVRRRRLDTEGRGISGIWTRWSSV